MTDFNLKIFKINNFDIEITQIEGNINLKLKTNQSNLYFILRILYMENFLGIK